MFENFYLPFGGHLRGDNRWVILAGQIPWSQIEEAYGELFSEDTGCPARYARMALGALLIKERLGTSDSETIEQIRENPYLQFFLGLMEYQDEPDRIAVEGKFGQGKRRFSLARIMTKLAQTSEVSIMVSFIVMNLEKILTGILSFLLFVWWRLLARLRSADLRCGDSRIAALPAAA